MSQQIRMILIALIAGVVVASIVYAAWGAVAAGIARLFKPAEPDPETDDERASEKRQ
jgi:hypothetical protein